MQTTQQHIVNSLFGAIEDEDSPVKINCCGYYLIFLNGRPWTGSFALHKNFAFFIKFVRFYLIFNQSDSIIK